MLASPLSDQLDLSIVVVTWNTRQLLANCLRSVLRSESQACQFEVIVVDNASTDGSRMMVPLEFPKVQLIQNHTNLGFARANNQGIRCSQGPYVLLLNSDTVVPDRTLAHMVQSMDSHPQAGGMGPRLVLPDGRPQPYSYGCDPTLGYLFRRGLNLLLGRGHLHDWGTEQITEVDWVSGASLMLRRTALEETGLLDENFFLYFEDNDLCLRLRQKGWKVYFNPTVEVLHLGGQSLIKNEPARAEYYHSLVYFYRKHYGKSTVPLMLLLPLYRLLIESRGRGETRPPEVES